jgi:hypothetical protein
VLDSTRISNLEQPWMGVILYWLGVNTHKELDLEVLMTLAPVISGVLCLWFRLEYEEQLVPYGYIGELLGYKKKARSKLMSKKKNVRRIFGEWFREKITSNPKFLLVGISLGIWYIKKGNYISGDERRGCKLTFLFPTWGWIYLLKGDKNWLKEGFLVPEKKIKKENCVRGITLRSPRQRRGCTSS